MPTKHEQTVSSYTLTKAISIDGQTVVFQLAKVYGYGEDLSREDLKRLAGRYGPWQGYWAHYLRVGS